MASNKHVTFYEYLSDVLATPKKPPDGDSADKSSAYQSRPLNSLAVKWENVPQIEDIRIALKFPSRWLKRKRYFYVLWHVITRLHLGES